MEYRYEPEGVCSYEMIFEIEGDIVKSLKIVEDHKGTIRAEVGTGNVGTKFIITLPLIKS